MKLHFLSHKVISNKSTELAFVNHKPSSIHIKRDGKVISVSFKSDSRVQSPSNLFSDVSDETIKQFHIENLPIPPDTSNPTGNSNKTNDEELTSIGGSSLSSEDFHFDQSLNLTLGDYTINLQNTDEISLNLTLNDLIDKINNESSSSESNESSFSQGETTSDSDASIEKSIASIALTGPLSFIGDLHLNESIFQWYHLASKFPKSEKSISQLLCKYASCHIENKPTFDKLIKEWTKLFENDQDMARFILDETYDLIQATFPPCLKGILNLIGYINAYKEQEKKLEEIIQSEFETESKKSEHQKVLNVVKELTDFQKDKTQERIQSTIASMQALYKNLSDKDKPESKIEFFKQLDTEKPSPFQEYTDLTRAQLVAAGNFKASFSADSSSETTEMPLTYYDPRKASIISWIYEGLKIAYPIPNELRAVNGVDEFFDRLYNIQTDLAAFNFRLDDYADELRDLKLVHLFSELFPNMDDVELDIHRKLSDGTNLDSKEAVESYLQQHTTLEQEPYTSNGNDNLKQAIIASLVSAWASYDSAIKSFKVLINEAATQVRGDALYEDEMVSLLAHIILKYKDVFRNFILACEANINPGDNGKLILAAEKVHNNMNMIPFHMMASILSLTLFGKNPDEIAQIIENSGYSKLNVNLQKAARYGNNISSAARELDKGDISGHLEILGYYFKTNQNWKLNPRQRYQKCLIDMKKISSRNQGLAKLRREFFNSDDPDLKADSLSLRWFAHEINNRFEENKSELALVLKKDISGITEENVKKIIELIFPTDSEPAYKLLLFHLIGRGSI